MAAISPALLAHDPPIPVRPLPFTSRPQPVAPGVAEHPSAIGPFGHGVINTGPSPAPQVIQVAVVSPLVTRASVINGIANIEIRGGTVASTVTLGAGAVNAMAHDTAAKRLPHNGVIDQAMSLNLVSLFASSALGAF